MKQRCEWCLNTFDAYVQYHDEEWGVPVYDDRTHFEFLILEGAQAGLSWSTILKKRQGYREAFAEFDVNAVAQFTESQAAALKQFKGIVRNELKIKATINNAKLFKQIQEEVGSFSDYIWHFVNNKPIVNSFERMDQVPATSPESDALAKDLKKRGFKFAGSTIMYAHMQACGLVNDHTVNCFRYQEIIDQY